MAEQQVPNPEGKGGFQERPEDINKVGRPPKEQTFSYWMNIFKNMPIDQFLNWPKSHPESERTVAADLSYERVFNARKELAEFREVADRTEGRPVQPTDLTIINPPAPIMGGSSVRNDDSLPEDSQAEEED